MRHGSGTILARFAILATVALMALAGCSKPPLAPEKQAEALIARTTALAPTLATADGAAAFDALVADVTAYNKSTARTDVTVQRGVVTEPGAGQVGVVSGFSALQNTGGGLCPADFKCPATPANAPAGYTCREDGASFCDPATGNRVCSYRCVRVEKLASQ